MLRYGLAPRASLLARARCSGQLALSTSTEATRKPSYRSLIAEAGESVSKSRAKGASWGQAIQEGVISYREGKMDESFKTFMMQSLAVKKYDIGSAFRKNIEESLKMTTLEKMRESMPWAKKDPAKLELEGQLNIIKNMTPLELLFPMQIGLEGKQKIALRAGVTAPAVSKLIKHFMQARAIHDFIHARQRWGKPMPNDTKEMFELMRVMPSSRGFALMIEANQRQRGKGRRIVNHQRPHFTRGH